MYRKSITTIENFTNEFFYKVFDYLDGCDIYQAFANLNRRFEQLLNSSSVVFKINLDNCLLTLSSRGFFSKKCVRIYWKISFITGSH
jgi:hypothetical protein